MDGHRDPDPVLQTIGEDLARDDPRLAALLGDLPRRRHRARGPVALLLVLGLLTPALLLAPTIALGTIALLLGAASPLVVCWLMVEAPIRRIR
jgi:hypothetical protein